jgi:hypothetical protein
MGLQEVEKGRHDIAINNSEFNYNKYVEKVTEFILYRNGIK